LTVNKRTLFGVTTLLVLVFVACLLFWLFQPGCPYLKLGFRNPCEFSRMFSADQLLVDSTIFDANDVNIEPFNQLNHHGAAERVVVDIFLDGQVLGSHEIERWTTSIKAAEIYETIYSDDALATFPCGIANNIDYKSPVATNFCAACSVGHHCRSVAQYQDYVSIFKLDTTSAFTESDFIEILVKIDQKFGEYLELHNTD
jgi:hypothetical protein